MELLVPGTATKFSLLSILLSSLTVAVYSANQQAQITIREGETPPPVQYVVSAEHNAGFASSCKAVCNGEASCLKICDSLDQNIQSGATQEQLDQVTNQLTSGIPGLSQQELDAARQQYTQQFAAGESATPITISQPRPPSTTTTTFGQPPPPSTTSFQPPPQPRTFSFETPPRDMFAPPPSKPPKEKIQWGVPQFPKLPPPRDPGLPAGSVHIQSTVPKFGQVLTVDDFKQKFGQSFFTGSQPKFGQVFQPQRQQQQRNQPQLTFSFGQQQQRQPQFGGFFGQQQQQQQPRFGGGLFGGQQQQQFGGQLGGIGGFGNNFGGGFGNNFGGGFGNGGHQGGNGFGGGFRAFQG